VTAALTDRMVITDVATFLNAVVVTLRFPSECSGFLSQCPGLNDAFGSGDADFLGDGTCLRCVHERAIEFARDVSPGRVERPVGVVPVFTLFHVLIRVAVPHDVTPCCVASEPSLNCGLTASGGVKHFFAGRRRNPVEVAQIR
jgi:hypothetical protein